MKLVVLLFACTACDVVLGTKHFDQQQDAPGCLAGDEDCDGQLDAVDICPADADVATVDDDADVVGDACDPDRGKSGNRIVLFDGFNDNSQPWTIKSGGWQLGAGAFTQPVIGDARVELAVTATTPSVEVVITELETTANGSVSVFGSSTGSELKCTVVHNTDGSEFLQITALFLNMQTQLTGAGTLRIEGGQHQDGTFYCRARHGSNFDAVVMSTPNPAQTIDHIGMLTSSGSTTVTSITLFDVP